MNLRRAWSGGPSRRASGRAAASRRRRRHTPPPLSPAAIPAGGALSPRPAHPRRAAPAATRAVRARLAPLPHRRRRPLGERRHFGRVRRRGRRETQPCGGAAAAVAVSARGGDGAAHLGHSRPLSATLGYSRLLSATPRPHLGCTSAAPRPLSATLGHTSATLGYSRLLLATLGHTSAAPRLHLGCTSVAPRLHLGCTSATPRLHLGCTSARRVSRGSGCTSCPICLATPRAAAACSSACTSSMRACGARRMRAPCAANSPRLVHDTSLACPRRRPRAVCPVRCRRRRRRRRRGRGQRRRRQRERRRRRRERRRSSPSARHRSSAAWADLRSQLPLVEGSLVVGAGRALPRGCGQACRRRGGAGLPPSAPWACRRGVWSAAVGADHAAGLPAARRT